MAGLLVGFFVGAYMHNGANQEPNNDNKKSLTPLLFPFCISGSESVVSILDDF